MRLKNYRRFLLLSVAASVALFFLSWGIVSVAQHLLLGGQSVGTLGGSEMMEGVISGESEEQLLILVNESQPLSPDFVPENIVELETEDGAPLYLQEEAARSLESLLNKAHEEGFDVFAASAYRSYQEQDQLNKQALANTGGALVGMENSAPGTNEHQTGLAVDLVCEETDYEIRQDFALTECGRWINDNAAAYGFIVRYPQGKEEITGNMYEPWHLRYVGVDNALEMTENGTVLEEVARSGDAQ